MYRCTTVSVSQDLCSLGIKLTEIWAGTWLCVCVDYCAYVQPGHLSILHLLRRHLYYNREWGPSSWLKTTGRTRRGHPHMTLASHDMEICKSLTAPHTPFPHGMYFSLPPSLSLSLSFFHSFQLAASELRIGYPLFHELIRPAASQILTLLSFSGSVCVHTRSSFVGLLVLFTLYVCARFLQAQ